MLEILPPLPLSEKGVCLCHCVENSPEERGGEPGSPPLWWRGSAAFGNIVTL